MCNCKDRCLLFQCACIVVQSAGYHCPPIHLPACISVAHTGQIFVKFYIGGLVKSVEEFHIWLQSDEILGYSH
jgi:hypothetical protein